MREQELKCQELFDSPEEVQELIRPTAAFITFEEEDAKLLVMHKNLLDHTFLDQPMKFEETSEPTDIIWENRHWTVADIFGR